MTSLAEAEHLVERARRRLVAGSRLRAGCGGLLVGSLASVAAWAACQGLDLAPRTAVLAALPVLGAVVAATAHPAGRISRERAALALDRAAATDEAFVSALTAERASPVIRERAAAYGLARCAASRLAEVLPVRAPRLAPHAALAAALLAALLAVPSRGAPAAEPAPPRTGGTEVRVPGAGGGGGGGAAATPSERARALVDALQQQDAAAPRDADAVRRDVPSLGREELAELARTLAAGEGDRAAAAREALAALERGDAAAAERALDRALADLGTGAGAGRTATGGTETGEAGPARPAAAPDLPGAAGWPLRYDREVRRWFEAEDARSGPAPGGGR